MGKFNFWIELYSFLKCFMLGTSELRSELYLTVIKHFLFFISTFTLLKNYSVQEMPSFFLLWGENVFFSKLLFYKTTELLSFKFKGRMSLLVRGKNFKKLLAKD